MRSLRYAVTTFLRRLCIMDKQRRPLSFTNILEIPLKNLAAASNFDRPT